METPHFTDRDRPFLLDRLIQDTELETEEGVNQASGRSFPSQIELNGQDNRL